MWKYPVPSDITSVEPEKVLDCYIEGEWDNISGRNTKYKPKNYEIIQKNFEKVQ